MDRAEAERAFEHDFLRMETLPQMFEQAAGDHAGETAQLYKGGVHDRSLTRGPIPEAPDGEFLELNYGETRDLVRKLAAGFRDLGLAAGDRVGVFSETRLEWALSDLALLAAGGVVTTVYRESSPDQVRFLLGDAGATGVVVDDPAALDRVLAVEDDLDLSFVVVMDAYEEHGHREDVHSLGEVYERGSEAYDLETYRGWLAASDVEDLATLVYTSGTTGRPKGVELTHRNVRSNINQTYRRFGPRPDKDDDLPTVDADMELLSYLPLAHILERSVGHFLPLGVGASIAYAESPDTLQADMQLVRPSAMINVPRIFERIYDGMREQASESGTKERIFEWAMAVARRYQRTDNPGIGLRAKHRLADRLVYSTVKEGMGGNVEILNSGGGTLSKDLAELFQGMGIDIYEGYGMTEASPVVTSNPPENTKAGTIGPPLPGVDIEVDPTVVPEGGMSDTLGETGELLVDGPNVTDGYWNKPEATESAFTDEGYFRTGDIVTVRPDGYLVFHERSKQLIVLSTGKNVAPQPIEEQFADSDLVEQVMVLGDERKFVSALVVPNVEGVRRWADRTGVDLPDDPAAICADDRVRRRIQEVVEEVNDQFEDHEQVGDFRLIPEAFTQDNDLLTPTMKKKRRNIREAYRDEIAAIYDGAVAEGTATEAAGDD